MMSNDDYRQGANVGARRYRAPRAPRSMVFMLLAVSVLAPKAEATEHDVSPARNGIATPDGGIYFGPPSNVRWIRLTKSMRAEKPWETETDAADTGDHVVQFWFEQTWPRRRLTVLAEANCTKRHVTWLESEDHRPARDDYTGTPSVQLDFDGKALNEQSWGNVTLLRWACKQHSKH